MTLNIIINHKFYDDCSNHHRLDNYYDEHIGDMLKFDNLFQDEFHITGSYRKYYKSNCMYQDKYLLNYENRSGFNFDETKINLAKFINKSINSKNIEYIHYSTCKYNFIDSLIRKIKDSYIEKSYPLVQLYCSFDFSQFFPVSFDGDDN